MEIQLGPRSTEADGRALGTGRSSTPPSNSTPLEALEERRADLVAARKADLERKVDRQSERSQRPARCSFGDDLRARRAEAASARAARSADQPTNDADSTEGAAEGQASTTGAEASVEIKSPAGREGAAAPAAAIQPRSALAPASTPISTSPTASATHATVDAVPAPAVPVALAAPVALVAPAGDLAPALADAPAVVDAATVVSDAQAKPGKEAVAQAEARLAGVEQGRLSEIPDNKPEAQAANARTADERSARQVEARDRAADLLRQIGVQLSPQTRTAVVDLHPRELGRIHIRMSVEGGRVRASLRAERPEALEALERHLPELRAELARAGLDAQELSLSLGFEGRRGGAEARDGRQARHAAHAPDLRAATTDELAFVARRIARDGGVDTFA